jgi:cell division protein FtsN
MAAPAVTLRAQQHSSPQPLADISLGAGRLASQLVNSITNPKEDKDLAKKRKEWQRKQDEEKAQQQAEQQQQQQEQQQAAAAALTDPLGLDDAEQAGGAEAVAAAEGVAADAAAAAAVPEAFAVAGERSIVSEYTGELLAAPTLSYKDCQQLL